jgi:hypothetical protein
MNKMTGINYKELTDIQLKELIEAAKRELDSRKKTELALYTHDCKNAARHHLGKYKHWSKLVTSVDTSKTNGYAFGGDFLTVTAEHKIPVGSVVVEVCGGTIEAYIMKPEGKEHQFKAPTSSMSNFIEKVAELV